MVLLLKVFGKKNVYSVILYCDMLSYDVVFEEPEDPTSRSFFSEIIASISDVRFSHSGRYVLSRDYLTVKVGAVCIHLFCYHSY